MLIILFRLLMIQLSIQFSLTVVLEGRTSHYVNLLDSPVVDPSAQRITCPVYKIRPADSTAEFIKYAASQAQYDMIDDWEERTGALTFKDCASVAATNEDKMFLFDDGACNTSKTLFTRLPETCGDENAVIVYMVETPENACAGEYITLENRAVATGTFCNQPTVVEFTCFDGVISGFNFGALTAYFSVEGGCFTIHTSSPPPIPHSQHAADCIDKSLISCVPADAASRPAFNQIMKAMAGYIDSYGDAPNIFMVDCNAPSPGDTYLWSNNVEQPTDVVGEWNTTYPTTDNSTEKFVYASAEGLINSLDNADVSLYCCYNAN